MINNWDEFYLKMAYEVSLKSKDRSTKVGAVIVGQDNEIRSIGYNGFPRGVDDDVEERHERPAKYMYTEHAERNAIFNAVRANIPIKGCKMYLNFAPYPCCDCTRAVIQSGIVEIITSNMDFSGIGGWTESLKVGGEMLKECGIIVRKVDFNPNK